jgi:hypothetical protein
MPLRRPWALRGFLLLGEVPSALVSGVIGAMRDTVARLQRVPGRAPALRDLRSPVPRRDRGLADGGTSPAMIIRILDSRGESAPGAGSIRNHMRRHRTSVAVVARVMAGIEVFLLSRTATLLRRSTRDPNQVVTGPIVEVRHLPNDPSGEIAVRTMRGGRINEIRVRLQQPEIDNALEWMRTARAVLVEGPLVRTPGQPLRIVAPERIHPLDEAFLPLGQDESGR